MHFSPITELAVVGVGDSFPATVVMALDTAGEDARPKLLAELSELLGLLRALSWSSASFWLA